MSIHELCRLIDGCDALSLDVFDTALLRRVSDPEDVFALVERHYRHLRGGVARFPFAAERAAAERRARAAVGRDHGRGDVTLDEIYAHLAAPDGWDPAALRALELDAERAVCAQNPYIHAAYRHARERGKRIVFTSDMYLPPEFISGILRDNGYHEFESIFVSSARGGASKHSGALYHQVTAELGLAGGRLLHIGDNPFSDVAMALLRGVGAVLYERCGARAARGPASYHGPEISGALYRGITCNRLFANRGFDNLGFWYRFGFEILGVLRAGFGADEGAQAGAFGGDPRVEVLLALREPDPRVQRLAEGARDFCAELDGVRAIFPWLTVEAHVARAPLARVLAQPTAEESLNLDGLWR